MRKVMVQVQCSRCERKEEVEYDPQKDMPTMPSTPPSVLVATLRSPEGESLKVGFDDLCGPCYRSVKALLEQVGKRIKGLSPDRETKPKKDETKEAPAETKDPKSETKAKKEEPTPNPAPTPRSPQPVAAKR